MWLYGVSFLFYSEFIQTEKSHCRTLKIMHKIFYNGLLKECDLSQEMVDRIFPRLFELLDIHLLFLNKLLKRQAQTQDRSLEVIGDLLYEQVSNNTKHVSVYELCFGMGSECAFFSGLCITNLHIRLMCPTYVCT